MIKKYDLYKEPYIRKADYKYYGTDNIMIDFLISLLPIILIGWYQNGIVVFMNNKSIISLFYPLLFVLLGGLFTFLTELIYFYITNKKDKNYLKKAINSYAIIPGLLLSLILPLNTPIWVLLIGCIFASFIGKIIFGGFGNNIFNPALLGYVFIMTAFYGVINKNEIDIISSSTPLNSLNNILRGNVLINNIINKENILSFCFGLKYGTMAEVSNVACIISFIYLIIRKVIDYKTTIICLLTFYITCFIVALFININPLLFSVYNLFSGGIIFGAVFMVTEPVTSPRSVYGKIIYSFFIGLITLILRLLSDLNDGTSTAILFMNMLSLFIDNFASKIRVENNKIKKLKPFIIIFLIYITFTSYSIIKLKSLQITDNNEINIEIINIKQDYSLLKDNIISFIYEVKINNTNYYINSDIDGNITSNLNDYEEDIKEQLIETIKNNKINKKSIKNHYGYIKSIEEINENEYKIITYSRGYIDNVIITFNYNNGILSTINVDLTKETELSGGLQYSNGSKQDLLDLGNGERSDIISNVTYTSIALISCRQVISDYIDFLNGGSNE